jgi:hypothetical protein
MEALATLKLQMTTNVEAAVTEAAPAVRELTALELELVGGGIAAVAFV